MAEPRKPPAPRNHFSISLSGPTHAGPPRSQAAYDMDRLSGDFEFAIEVVTPVHVGAGAYVERDGSLVRACVRREGRPVVPGTSIKGAVRMVHEAITESASAFDEQKLGPTPSGNLFGALGRRGSVSFDDAVPESGADVQTLVTAVSATYPPKREGGRRFYGHMPKGAIQPPTTPVECIPVGVNLFSRLRFLNLTREGLGSVLSAMGMWSQFHLRLGAGRYHALGWVMIQPVSCSVVTRAQLLGRPAARLEGDDVGAWVEDLVGAFQAEGAGAAALSEIRAKLGPDQPDWPPEPWRR